MSPSSIRSSTEPSGPAPASPEADPRTLAPSSDPKTSSLRKPHRGRVLRRSWNTLMPGSRSLEALLEKTKATFSVKNEGPDSEGSSKVQRTFSQGSVAAGSSGKQPPAGSSLLPLEPTAPRLDSGAWGCHGPFSHCFLRRRSNAHGSDEDGEMPSHALVGKSEQSNTAKSIRDMSLKERLAHLNSMKGKTYSLHTGFALARKDALEMISVLRCSVRHKSRSEVPAVQDMQTFSQLLSTQAKVLSGACSQMAMEYGSPEELLLTLTHSFHSLCCLMQACVSLVEGLSAESERREAVAKVDEVVMNYTCLLKAAEVAAAGSTGDRSVNALTHYSATTSAIINTLTHSLETLLDKKRSFSHDYRF